jgi:hypothetical protein
VVFATSSTHPSTSPSQTSSIRITFLCSRTYTFLIHQQDGGQEEAESPRPGRAACSPLVLLL